MTEGAGLSAREFSFEAGGLRWGGLEWGPPEGRLVIALHGWLDNAASFSGMGPILGAAGLRMLSLDLPGHGKTVPGVGFRAGGTYRVPMHLVDYVAPLRILLKALSPDQPVSLLGHSMGAGVALLYAGAFPAGVSRLALIEGLGPLSGSEKEGPERLKRHAEAMESFHGKSAPVYPRAEQIEAIVRKRAAAGGITQESARVLIERAMERTPEGWMWRTDPLLRLPGPFRMTEDQIYPFIDQITCPVLVFIANEGFPHAPEQAEKRLERLKKVQLERVVGGHHVHLDEPSRVAPAANAFLSEPGGQGE